MIPYYLLSIWFIIGLGIQPSHGQSSDCLPIAAVCTSNGSMGYCCSGFCYQELGQPTGTCQNRTGPFVTTTTAKPPTSISNDTVTIVVTVTVILVILVVAVATALIFGFKYFRAKQNLRDLSEEEIKEFREGDAKAAEKIDDGMEKAWLLPFADNYAIPSNALIIDRECVLGEGEFGVVWKGKLFHQLVAVKSTKGSADVDCVKAIMKELKIQAYIGKHPHIVEFFGAEISHLRERVVYSVVELCPMGNLNSFLRQNSDSYSHTEIGSKIESKSGEPEVQGYQNVTIKLKTSNLVKWCKQIADGMEFLANKKVVHADLACRNVLVFSSDLVKISDFGLSRQLYEQGQYVKKQMAPLPWRWMAIESLKFMEFSSQSDVWSFGVTVWEIFSFGNSPFPGLSWTFDFQDDIEAGLRMKKPKFMNQHIYEVLLNCWKLHGNDRPLFSELKVFFSHLLDQMEPPILLEREGQYTHINAMIQEE